MQSEVTRPNPARTYLCRARRDMTCFSRDASSRSCDSTRRVGEAACFSFLLPPPSPLSRRQDHYIISAHLSLTAAFNVLPSITCPSISPGQSGPGPEPHRTGRPSRAEEAWFTSAVACSLALMPKNTQPNREEGGGQDGSGLLAPQHTSASRAHPLTTDCGLRGRSGVLAPGQQGSAWLG